jgi:hypothetical protein
MSHINIRVCKPPIINNNGPGVGGNKPIIFPTSMKILAIHSAPNNWTDKTYE